VWLENCTAAPLGVRLRLPPTANRAVLVLGRGDVALSSGEVQLRSFRPHEGAPDACPLPLRHARPLPLPYHPWLPTRPSHRPPKQARQPPASRAAGATL
jgi:hypothetical protein